MKLQFAERPDRSMVRQLGLPVVAILMTLAITSTAIIGAGANPLTAFHKIFVVPLTTRFSVLELLVSATPLILTGTAVALAFSGGYYSIGAEGQLTAGAIVSTWVGIRVGGWPGPLAITAMIVAGATGGILWALIPALLRVRFGIDEVVTTLLLNPVAALVVSGLLNGPWRNSTTQYPESDPIATAARLPKLVDRSRLHLGFVIALVMAGLAWFVLTKTVTGLRARAVGQAAHASRFAGLRVERTLLGAALASGAIAGLAGMNEVAGTQFKLSEGLAEGKGYTGIVIATLAALSIVGVVAAALLLGLVKVGASSASRSLGVPSQIGSVIVGCLLLCTVAVTLLQRYRLRLVRGRARR
ncbi:MAG: ABC transporter permease [Ilumatobacteraceae bacterium]